MMLSYPRLEPAHLPSLVLPGPPIIILDPGPIFLRCCILNIFPVFFPLYHIFVEFFSLLRQWSL